MPDWFSQKEFTIRLEWGRRGARRAAARGDAIVVVDILSFSSSVVAGTERGAWIFPARTQEEADMIAFQQGGIAAVHRLDVSVQHPYSLSPLTLTEITPETRIAIASPNGANCCRYAANAPYLFAGCFLNAQAVGSELTRLLQQNQITAVTLLACGERWQEVDETEGTIRFSLEDYLGVGAVAYYLPPEFSRSPEVQGGQAAFAGLMSSLDSVLASCGSGVELTVKGFKGDVQFCARLNAYSVVPCLQECAYFTTAPREAV